MYVPNYIPEPLEVPGNVTLAPYPVRLAFIRRVTILHAVGLIVIAALALLPFPRVELTFLLGGLAIFLILLDVLRITLRGEPREATWSSCSLPVLLPIIAWTAHELYSRGIPTAALLAGPACALLYTLLCGKDYSFVGCALISLIASSTILAAILAIHSFPSQYAAWALGGNTVYLLYHCYDLASLMARRRRGEEMAALVDLFRDVFNIFGYIPRVIGHWRKHRIWTQPRSS